MGRAEEAELLLRTGCPPANVDALLKFAGAYRTRMVPADGALRVRRLGTRALLRIARRLARFPWDQDVRSMLERALLMEFLPAAEKAGVEELLEEAGIRKISPVVRLKLTPFCFVPGFDVEKCSSIPRRWWRVGCYCFPHRRIPCARLRTRVYRALRLPRTGAASRHTSPIWIISMIIAFSQHRCVTWRSTLSCLTNT